MNRIKDWANQYPRSTTQYTTAVCVFLAFIYGIEREPKITRDLLGRYEDLADRYITDQRDYPQDVIRFATSMKDRPPKTVRQYLSSIKEFLIYYDIEISEKDLRKIRQRTPKGGAVTVQRDLDPETLRSILAHLNLMMRALILLLASSGMRIGEALALKVTDIALKEDEIGQITIRAEKTKTRQQRYTFCSPEATNAILEWKKKREEYLQSAEGKGAGLGIRKSRWDDRLFPFSDNVVYQAWERALKAAGLHSRDPGTGRIQINIHLLRSFFTSQMKLAVPSDIVELLAGHRGYLSDAYRRYTKKQAAEFYEKGVPYVTVMVTADVRELQTSTREKMAAHSEIIQSIVKENLELKRDVSDLRDEIRAVRIAVGEKEKNISSGMKKG
jgi:integrase